MARIHVEAEGVVDAPADRVYSYIADYHQHHPHILPPAFSDLVVEEGGVGAGTRIRFRAKMAGQNRIAQARVDEPEPGRVLTESYLGSDMVTSFTVLPEGDRSRVRIETTWHSGGLKGLIERLTAPRMLRRIYADELQRLDRYARQQGATVTL